MDREALYLKVQDILVEQFDVEESSVTEEANLYDELNIDSIDAVDLLVQLKSITGKTVAPEMFKDVRTIRDLLDALTEL
jgi:acyl carrier protein